MIIVFLCGSLEPGHDGVGDYTRRLAAELLRQQHQAVIIAFDDRQVTEQTLEELQPEDDQTVFTLRLSSKLSLADRSRRASAFITAINPDWISLQYVPFSFHDKGLPVGLSSALQQLSGGRPVHIMFHELWVGMSKQSPRKHVWWGQVQRHLVRSLVTTLSPKVTHTHTPLYQIQLGKLGIRTSILPLFSNIARLPAAQSEAEGHTPNGKSRIGFVFFGGIFPGAPVDAFAEEIARYAVQKKTLVTLTIIGRSGPEQETWVTAWRSRGLDVDLLGEQSSGSISKVLLQSTIGLSTTPAALSGKSGSIAAMHAHGLPVLCVSAPWQPRDIQSLRAAPGIREYTVGNIEQVLNDWESIRFPSVSVTDVTHQLVDALSAVPNRIPANFHPSL